jgi:hypothetical protein
MKRGLGSTPTGATKVCPAILRRLTTYAIYNQAGARTGTYSTPVYFNAANGNTTYNPAYNKILQIDNGGRLWYDGLIAEFHRRETRYLQTNFAYTFSHAEDLGQGTFSSNYYFSDQGDTYFNGSSIIDGRSGYSCEKGRSLEDQRNRLVITAVGTSPDINSDSTFAKHALNGWMLAPIFTFATAQYVDSYVTVGGLTAATAPAGSIRAGHVTTGADPRLYVPTPTLSGIGAETPGSSRVPFLPTATCLLGAPFNWMAGSPRPFRFMRVRRSSFLSKRSTRSTIDGSPA